MLRMGDKVRFTQSNSAKGINIGDTGLVVYVDQTLDRFNILLDHRGSTFYGVPRSAVELLPAVGSLSAAAKIFGIDPSQIVPPLPPGTLQDICPVPLLNPKASSKANFANGHGLTSSIGPVEEFAKPFEPRTFPSYSCNCGASAVGVEKHDNKCPRKAIEDQIVVKQ